MGEKRTKSFGANCLDCEHHQVVKDPYPGDKSCDDVANLCVKVAQTATPESKWAANRHPFRQITCSCDPQNLRKESARPDWCPNNNE